MLDHSAQVMKRSINYRGEVAGRVTPIDKDVDGFGRNRIAMRAALERLGIELGSWRTPAAGKPGYESSETDRLSTTG